MKNAMRFQMLAVFLLVVFFLSTSQPLSLFAQTEQGDPRTAKPLTPSVAISKETTYFTGPLKSDGSIDFFAAINDRFSEGLTPENNAARIIVPILDKWYLNDGERFEKVIGALEIKHREGERSVRKLVARIHHFCHSV